MHLVPKNLKTDLLAKVGTTIKQLRSKIQAIKALHEFQEGGLKPIPLYAIIDYSKKL